MLEPDFTTKWNAPIYLKIENGTLICNSIVEGETLIFESVKGRLNNIYPAYRSFKSGIFKYWHIELIDDINTYLICFPYTNAMFQKIILKLITTETYEDIQIIPYRDNTPYLRKEHSKARVYSNGKELDMMQIKLPSINCYKYGEKIRKDYSQRIAMIEEFINCILLKIQNASTQAREQPT